MQEALEPGNGKTGKEDEAEEKAKQMDKGKAAEVAKGKTAEVIRKIEFVAKGKEANYVPPGILKSKYDTTVTVFKK